MLPSTRETRLACYGSYEGYPLAMAVQCIVEQANTILVAGPGY